MRYAFIQASLEDSELKDIPIAKRCEVLEVSVSGYHAWVKRQRMPVKCKKVISDETVLRQAKIIRNEMKYTPGYRQMHALMRQRGVCIGVKRLRGVLRVNGIIGYRHFKRTVKTTDSNHNMFVYPNLLGRDFAPGTLNRAWVSDITYLPTTQGWGFLATILDLGLGLSIWLYVRAVATLLRERSCTRIEARSIVLLLSRTDLCNWT